MNVAAPIAEITRLSVPHRGQTPQELDRSPIWIVPSSNRPLGGGSLDDALRAAQSMSLETSRDVPLVGSYTYDLARGAQPVAVIQLENGAWEGAFLTTKPAATNDPLIWLYAMQNPKSAVWEPTQTGDGSDIAISSSYSPKLAAVALPNRSWLM